MGNNSAIRNSDRRIILWDIDGTILQSNIQGSFKQYFAAALEQVYGTHGKIFEVSASGTTDLQIVFKALEDCGFTVEDISAELDEFLAALCREMQRFISQNDNVYEILPGVRQVLETTSNNPRFLTSLLTGNVACGAKLKLGYVDVWQYFQTLPHTYGDISRDRRELGKAAEKKIRDFTGIAWKPEQFIVIGDTPQDITAARAFGAKVICVGTGRGIDYNELEREKPDALVKDLSNTKEILHLLETI